MLAAGEEIGSYTIDQPVARGRSGVVYRAYALDSRAVALKVHDNANAAAAEIDCLQTMQHPGVIDLLDHAELPDGGSWLALPWIEGETLGHLFDVSGPLSLDRTRRIITELAEALDALHCAGFVHGDLALSNVLISADDHVTIIDLATARRSTSRPQPLDRTADIQIATTPLFASPEVAAGHVPEPASDVYALALISYQSLTGRSPFAEVATPIAMLGHHASSIPDAPSEHRPDLPGAVEQALLAGLAKVPAHRPSASDLARLLSDDGPGNQGAQQMDGARDAGFMVKFSLVLILLVAAAGLYVLVDGLRRDSAGEVTVLPEDLALQLSGPAGSAASLLCNLATNTGFEAERVPEHFYLGDTTNTVSLVEGGGVDATSALRVGSNGAFGIFGEIVPIGSDATFALSAWMRRQGAPAMTTMYVDYLDADFAQITDMRAVALAGESLGTVAGEQVVIVSDAPDDAAFAVPTFFKDGSGGSLLVDEVTFGSTGSCLSGAGS